MSNLLCDDELFDAGNRVSTRSLTGTAARLNFDIAASIVVLHVLDLLILPEIIVQLGHELKMIFQ